MKFLITLLFLITTAASNAQSISITNKNIEAILLNDGSYVKIEDIQNGSDAVDGLILNANQIVIKKSAINSINYFQLHNGSNVSVDRVGGDMGGGGL